MHVLELRFPVTGNILPADNGYGLYSAISNALGGHLPADIAISSIGGPALGGRRIQVTRDTRLRIRTPAEQIAAVLPLAGKFLEIASHGITLGVPEAHALSPAPRLWARLVTIKGFTEPEAFLQAAERQLAAMEVTGKASIPLFDTGPRKGEARRRIIKIKDRTVVGFSFLVDELSDQHSYRLLAQGLGGRRHMGCGIFMSVREKREVNHGV